MSKTKTKLLSWFGILSLGNILAYLTVHLDYLFEPDALRYISMYVTSAWEFAYPVISLALILFVYSRSGLKTAFLSGALFSAARFFYTFFYYYLHFVINLSFVSSEAVLLSLLTSIGLIIATYLHLLVLFGIAILILHLSNRHRGEAVPMRKIISDGCDGITDLDSRVVICVLSASLLQFILNLALEIKDTADFLSTSMNTASVPELITIIFNYVFLLGILILTHTSSMKIFIKLNTTSKEGDNENGKAGI